jgi:8-oxo-dGTP diphosphatase
MGKLAEHCYPHPNPAVTTDIVIFTIREEKLELLLIKRKNDPFKGAWGLPGGFVNPDEDLDACAKRELAEETGVKGVYLEQLYTFGNPKRDPRERIITVAYYALAPAGRITNIRAASDAVDVAWYSLDKLPPLAFDHRQIVEKALGRLVSKLEYSTIALRFMPEKFSLTELQAVYEIIRGEALDKRNFRKWVISLGRIEETGEERREGNHRPAKLYRAKFPGKVEIIK